MSRPLRLEHSGAIWHVTSRGNERRALFRDEADRERFLAVLGSVAGMYVWSVHAYVLMDNHYHLLVETREPNLAPGMRQLNGIYSQAFNRRHDRSGHLMQGRYKAILVQREAHLLELARYVVLNPVRARAARSAREWRWSSYQATAGLSAAPAWLELDWLLSQFGRGRGHAQARYREFVSEGRGAGYAPWQAVVGQVVLGDETFCARSAALAPQASSEEIPRASRCWAWPTTQEVARAVAKAFGVGLGEIGRGGEGGVRAAIAVLAREAGGRPFSEIGAYLGVKAWSASHLASRARERAARDRGYRQLVAESRNRLALPHHNRQT